MVNHPNRSKYGPYTNLRVANDAEAAEIRGRVDEYLDSRKPFYMVADSPRPSGSRLVLLGHYATQEDAERSVAHRRGNKQPVSTGDTG